MVKIFSANVFNITFWNLVSDKKKYNAGSVII